MRLFIVIIKILHLTIDDQNNTIHLVFLFLIYDIINTSCSKMNADLQVYLHVKRMVYFTV
jgi:hypothetical protein